MSDKVTLIPVAKRTPNSKGISAPSKIRPSVEISEDEFETKYADTAHTRTVSFEADGVSNPQATTAYGNLLTYIKK